ncbi:MAG: nucleotidyltransferase domain-containing protein [Thermomicrobiales bacterium]
MSGISPVLPASVSEVVARVATVPGVVAVALGGSRARGTERPDSDWDLGLYYRDGIDTDAIRALGYEGTVVAPGDWGRIVNGGAWLTVEGVRVDLLYRDLDVVEHWLVEAEAGRFEVDYLPNHVAGLPTYTLAGELAQNITLHGVLPLPAFPAALRQRAPLWWEAHAAFIFSVLEGYAARGEGALCAALLARAVVSIAHARLASAGEWVLNEKGLIGRANLGDAAAPLAALGGTPRELRAAVAAVRHSLGM